jgi:hypothetical protein
MAASIWSLLASVLLCEVPRQCENSSKRASAFPVPYIAVEDALRSGEIRKVRVKGLHSVVRSALPGKEAATSGRRSRKSWAPWPPNSARARHSAKCRNDKRDTNHRSGHKRTDDFQIEACAGKGGASRKALKIRLREPRLRLQPRKIFRIVPFR